MRVQATRKNGRMCPLEIDVSARLVLAETVGTAPVVNSPNELTTTNSKFSPEFRSVRLFQTISRSAGASNLCNSTRIIRSDSESSPRAESVYNASVRVWACDARVISGCCAKS